MSNTFLSLNYHIVFSTEERTPLITNNIKDNLYAYIGGIVRDQKGVLLKIGGIADHVHMLVSLRADVALSDTMRRVKSSSSKWVDESHNGADKFAWQSGYSAFTVGCTRVGAVKSYIDNQEAHHKKTTYLEELEEFLQLHGIEYEQKYL